MTDKTTNQKLEAIADPKTMQILYVEAMMRLQDLMGTRNSLAPEALAQISGGIGTVWPPEVLKKHVEIQEFLDEQEALWQHFKREHATIMDLHQSTRNTLLEATGLIDELVNGSEYLTEVAVRKKARDYLGSVKPTN